MKPIPLRVRNIAFHLSINFVAILSIAMISFVTLGAAFAETGVQSNTNIQMAAANLVRPNDMNTGALLLPSKRDGYFIEAPRLTSDVEINVNGPIARVKVTQRFENPSEGWIEGVYVFPLPENSAIDTLKMRIGDRLIEGVIKVREEARQIYEKAKKEGKKAALLEQQRDNVFTNNIANIGPGELVIVQIEYQQTVQQDNGLFSLRFPMVVAPRYSPQPIVQTVDFSNGDSGFGVVDPVADRDKLDAPILDPRENAKINPVKLRVSLAAGFPLGSVESPFHKVKATVEDDSTQVITLENDSVPADRDFVINWRAKGEAPSAALFSETVNGETYVLAFVTPPEKMLLNLPKKQREAIFVIDNSGSMAGESMTQAKLALVDALKRLKPSDKFNIVRFDDTYETLFDGAVRADQENLAIALRFVKSLEAEGGTEMLQALQASLVDVTGKQAGWIRQVVFITDGAIGNEKQLFSEIAQNRGRSRVFTIGIGSAPNSYFMTRAAEIGRGTFTHIGSVDQVKNEMNAFFEKLENPVLTGLAVQGVGVKMSEVSPNPLPDLYKGEPIVVAAKVKDTTGRLDISGEFANQPWMVQMELENAKAGSGIGKLWARRKIASLDAIRYYGTKVEEVNREIEKVALEHGLVSSRTSLVAVDVKVTRPSSVELSTSHLPLNLPAGWDADKWFESESQTIKRIDNRAMAKPVNQQFALLASAPSKEGAAAIAKARKSVSLPQTATLADRNILLGLMIMFMALLISLIARMFGKTGQMVKRHERIKTIEQFERMS